MADFSHNALSQEGQPPAFQGGIRGGSAACRWGRPSAVSCERVLSNLSLGLERGGLAGGKEKRFDGGACKLELVRG